MSNYALFEGDALECLKAMLPNSVDCIVTSPPYWGLRDYGAEGQIGLEKTFAEFLDRLVEVFRECHRVLKPSGTMWVNMGDSYFTGTGSSRLPGGGSQGKEFNGPFCQPNRIPGSIDLPKKSLIGQPWRLAFALQDDGWILRSEIIWHKPNPMPESVQDRPTRAHETLFLFSKSRRYWYDAEAIRERLSPNTSHHSFETMDFKRRKKYQKVPSGWDTDPGSHGTLHRSGRRSPRSPIAALAEGIDERKVGYESANARTVWTIATAAYPEAHFATFPEEIPKRGILAGCPPDGTVLDPFAGSGTTLAVAVGLGRKGIGIEINPDYGKLIHERLRDVQTPLPFDSYRAA